MLGNAPEFNYSKNSAAFTSFYCPDTDFQIVFRRAKTTVDLFKGVPIRRWETPSVNTLPPTISGYNYGNQMNTKHRNGDIVACWQFFEQPTVDGNGALSCRQNALHLVPLDYDYKNKSLPNLQPCIPQSRFNYQQVPSRFVATDLRASGSPYRTCYTGVLGATKDCLRSV